MDDSQSSHTSQNLELRKSYEAKLAEAKRIPNAFILVVALVVSVGLTQTRANGGGDVSFAFSFVGTLVLLKILAIIFSSIT